MGSHRGFDIGPAFKNTDEDNQAWAAFLAEVLVTFANDPVLVDHPAYSYIYFDVGECPRLERDVCRFRRFSSKISGSLTYPAKAHIVRVEAIAQEHFGKDRVHAWDEYDDSGKMLPYYSYREVYAEQDRSEAEYRARRLAQKNSEPTQPDAVPA